MPLHDGDARSIDERFEEMIRAEFGPAEPVRRFGAWRPTPEEARRRRRRAWTVRVLVILGLALVVVAVGWFLGREADRHPAWAATLAPWDVQTPGPASLTWTTPTPVPAP